MASGSERTGERLALATRFEGVGGTSILRARYERGGEVLEIEKCNLADFGLDLTGKETLSVSLAIDNLTGETLVLYRLPDGEFFTLRSAGRHVK